MIDDTPRHYVVGWDDEGRFARREYKTSGDAIRGAKQAAAKGWWAYAFTLQQTPQGAEQRVHWRSFENEMKAEA